MCSYSREMGVCSRKAASLQDSTCARPTANRQPPTGESERPPRVIPEFPFLLCTQLSSPQLNSTRQPLLALSMKKSFASRRVPRKIGQDDQDALSDVSSNNG